MSGPGDEVLDNPVLSSLMGPHAGLAVAAGKARVYAPEIAVFVGLPRDPSPQDWADLASLLGPGNVGVQTGSDLWAPPDWAVEMALPGVQMVATEALVAQPYDQAVPLGEDDVAEMLELVARTQPGPFQKRTRLMGSYLGVRVDGRLVAMAGERLHPPGWVEVSAVCTDPDFRGRGYATGLVSAVVHGVRQRGEQAMLHAAGTNTTAIRLYEAMGFAVRKETTFMAVRSPGPAESA